MLEKIFLVDHYPYEVKPFIPLCKTGLNMPQELKPSGKAVSLRHPAATTTPARCRHCPAFGLPISAPPKAASRSCHSSRAPGASVRAAPCVLGKLAHHVVQKLRFSTTWCRFTARFPRPPAAPYLSATRRRPAAYLMILPPLRSGITIKVYQRVAARRPPLSAFLRAALPGAWRMGWRERRGNMQPRRWAGEYDQSIGTPWRSRPSL
jgi:hypothetical protein